MTRFFASMYAKMIFGGFVAFASVAAGIYIGYAITGKRSQEYWALYQEMQHEMDPQVQPTLRPGDLFPTVDCTDLGGSKTNFEQVIGGKPTIFFFMAFGCEPCYNLLRFWVEKIDPILIQGAQVVICVPSDAGDIPPAYAHLWERKRLIQYDKQLFKEMFNVVLFPTIITVDNYGFIRHIQLGFSKTLDYEIYEDMTNPSR